MPVKRKNVRRLARRRRHVRILQCGQCGESNQEVVFRSCGGCRVLIHWWCLVHHHVDHAGDGQHAPRDYSHLPEAA